ncbi:SRPBCC family protein [Palleronia sp. LCG004]|uniref:SRPBCC family protein n=1 Tax=Palleronia sp. LCG004 TaxID=3079304 RepID=UPI00294244C3|nr:SRPBCC family protein [Palleronia sp. LCG004]WOI56777.1 SRPBCC family protein [Palleronia sp. LCG004]
MTRDIRAPRARIFDALSDFETIENRLRGRGALVERVDDGGAGPSGAAWRLEFDLLEKRRALEAHVIRIAPDDALAIAARSSGLDLTLDAVLSDTSGEATRMTLDATILAATLKGKVLLQSMKLARSRITRAIENRIDDLVVRAEQGRL